MGLGALAMDTIPWAQHGAGSGQGEGRLLPGSWGRGGWRATDVWQWARKQGAAGVTRAGPGRAPGGHQTGHQEGCARGNSSEQQRVRHSFPSLHFCRHHRPHPPSPSGTSPYDALSEPGQGSAEDSQTPRGSLFPGRCRLGWRGLPPARMTGA